MGYCVWKKIDFVKAHARKYNSVVPFRIAFRKIARFSSPFPFQGASPEERQWKCPILPIVRAIDCSRRAYESVKCLHLHTWVFCTPDTYFAQIVHWRIESTSKRGTGKNIPLVKSRLSSSNWTKKKKLRVFVIRTAFICQFANLSTYYGILNVRNMRGSFTRDKLGSRERISLGIKFTRSRFKK